MLRETEPSVNPKQLMFMLLLTADNKFGWVIITVSFLTQPFPSVTEKGYVPAGIPFGKNCAELTVFDPSSGRVCPKAFNV